MDVLAELRSPCGIFPHSSPSWPSTVPASLMSTGRGSCVASSRYSCVTVPLNHRNAPYR